MLIPAESIATADLEGAKPNSIIVAPESEGKTLLWVIESEGRRYTIFLNGEYSQHCFEIKTGSRWPGSLIAPVEVRVDPASALQDNGDRSWHLKASEGELGVSAIMQSHGFKEEVWLPLRKVGTVSSKTIYFARWSIGIQGAAPSEWTELVRAENGALTISLL